MKTDDLPPIFEEIFPSLKPKKPLTKEQEFGKKLLELAKQHPKT